MFQAIQAPVAATTIRENSALYHNNILWSVLDGTKQAQDDHDDVKEVDHDGSPLVAQEVKHLLLHGCYLERQQKQRQSLVMADEISNPNTSNLSLLCRLDLLHHPPHFWVFTCVSVCVCVCERESVVKATQPQGTKHAWVIASCPLGSIMKGAGWETERRRTKWEQPLIVAGCHFFS